MDSCVAPRDVIEIGTSVADVVVVLFARKKVQFIHFVDHKKHIFFLEHANIYCVMINGYWVSVLTFKRNWRFFQHIFHVFFLLKQIAIFFFIQCLSFFFKNMSVFGIDNKHLTSFVGKNLRGNHNITFIIISRSWFNMENEVNVPLFSSPALWHNKRIIFWVEM